MNPPSFLTSSLLVALGGGIGSWLRYMIGRAATALLGPISASAFPWATLTVNISGSFAMGLLAGWLAHFGNAGGLGGEGWRLLLGVGALGGFTTFSAFSLEIVNLAQRGQIGAAVFYVAISLTGGIAGLFCGLAATRVVA